MALPTVTDMPAPSPAELPALPKSWSELSWRQLTDCWACKLRFGGNGDAAQAAALLKLCGLSPVPSPEGEGSYDPVTGEKFFTLHSSLFTYTVTPRELAQMARQALPWFHYPYGDPGKEAVRDDKGKVVEEAVAPVRGYVNPNFRDAMQLPEETVVVAGDRIVPGSETSPVQGEDRRGLLHFQLPQVACNNLTWQQYRSLQAIAPQLFREGVSDDDVVELQAQFMAHIMVPAAAPSGRVPAAATTPAANAAGINGDPFTPPHVFTYDPDRAEQSVAFWRDKLAMENGKLKMNQPSAQLSIVNYQLSILFHILFQTYQTAVSYYAQVFPLLFSGGGKSDPLQDALTGETRTLNAVMKYQGYTRPEDVYAENLPVILSTLNTMAEEAKQIEQMNAKIKHKR